MAEVDDQMTRRDWYESDVLWERTYPFMFPPSVFSAAPEQVAQVQELAKVPGGRLLDLCCGPGRHAIPFAKAGFSVTAVDRTNFLLERARSYARSEDVEVEWVLEDMRRFLRLDSFDLALSLYTSFGYFDEDGDNLSVLHNVYRSLKSGGAFVLDMMGKEVLARIFEATGSSELDDGRLLVQRRKATDDWSRMDLEWIVIDEDGPTSFRLHHWIYSGRELREMLLRSGFGSVELFGDLEGAPYGVDASRLVAVARKG
jgi:SAM-dependent methyltransferase